jgi:hypothetical protein
LFDGRSGDVVSEGVVYGILRPDKSLFGRPDCGVVDLYSANSLAVVPCSAEEYAEACYGSKGPLPRNGLPLRIEVLEIGWAKQLVARNGLSKRFAVMELSYCWKTQTREV